MYYVVKVTITEQVDTKTGTKDVRRRYQYLVNAVSVTDAEVKMNEDMRGTVGDYEITGVSKSQIESVIE